MFAQVFHECNFVFSEEIQLCRGDGSRSLACLQRDTGTHLNDTDLQNNKWESVHRSKTLMFGGLSLAEQNSNMLLICLFSSEGRENRESGRDEVQV